MSIMSHQCIKHSTLYIWYRLDQMCPWSQLKQIYHFQYSYISTIIFYVAIITFNVIRYRWVIYFCNCSRLCQWWVLYIPFPPFNFLPLYIPVDSISEHSQSIGHIFFSQISFQTVWIYRTSFWCSVCQCWPYNYFPWLIRIFFRSCLSWIASKLMVIGGADTFYIYIFLWNIFMCNLYRIKQ